MSRLAVEIHYFRDFDPDFMCGTKPSSANVGTAEFTGKATCEKGVAWKKKEVAICKRERVESDAKYY